MRCCCFNCGITWDDGKESFLALKENVYKTAICEECVNGKERNPNIVWKIKLIPSPVYDYDLKEH